MDEEAEINPAFKKPDQPQLVRGTLLGSPDTRAEMLLIEFRQALAWSNIRMSASERVTFETVITCGICTEEDAAFVRRLHAAYNITELYWR